MQFSIFPDLSHAITTRANGVSIGPYASRNLGFHVGDDIISVRENRRLMAEELGFDVKQLVCAQQVHEKNIALVTKSEIGSGALDLESAIPSTDALVTNEAGVPLLILVADCAPILLFDSTKRVLAVVHAGWRGAVAGIAGETIQFMAKQFGCEAENVRAGIGPCLCAKNLEVGGEVVDLIPQKSVLEPYGEKWTLDLRELIVLDLKANGVRDENIEISPLCPKDRQDLFFSHRGQHGVAGRFGIVAWL